MHCQTNTIGANKQTVDPNGIDELIIYFLMNLPVVVDFLVVDAKVVGSKKKISNRLIFATKFERN